jgi:hypothetical protein
MLQRLIKMVTSLPIVLLSLHNNNGTNLLGLIVNIPPLPKILQIYFLASVSLLMSPLALFRGPEQASSREIEGGQDPLNERVKTRR